jgi:hypothetical protein
LQSAEQNNPIGETWHPNHLATCKVQNKTTQLVKHGIQIT